MTVVDSRIERRRRQVGEERARHRLRRALVFLVAVALVAAASWLVRSPILQVREVVVVGAERSDPLAVAEGLGITQRTPTISVDEAALRSALLTDPWIAEAAVTVSWPGTVTIVVDERRPAAVLEDGSTWMLVASDGVTLEEGTGAPPGLPRLVGPLVAPGTDPSPAVLTSLAFLGALPADLATSSRVRLTEPLIAEVGGHEVRLGRAAEGAEKGRVLAALLDAGIAEGAVVDLSAPRHPAVADPRPEVEGEDEMPAEPAASG